MTTESIVRAYEDAARADTKATADDIVRWYRTHPERAGQWMVLVLRALMMDHERRHVFAQLGDPLSFECAADSFDWTRALDALAHAGVAHWSDMVDGHFKFENVTLAPGFMSEIHYVLEAQR